MRIAQLESQHVKSMKGIWGFTNDGSRLQVTNRVSRHTKAQESVSNYWLVELSHILLLNHFQTFKFSANFQNGFANIKNSEVKRVEDTESERKFALVATDDSVYKSDITDPNSSSINTFLAIRNKRTNEMRVSRGSDLKAIQLPIIIFILAHSSIWSIVQAHALRQQALDIWEQRSRH